MELRTGRIIRQSVLSTPAAAIQSPTAAPLVSPLPSSSTRSFEETPPIPPRPSLFNRNSTPASPPPLPPRPSTVHAKACALGTKPRLPPYDEEHSHVWLDQIDILLEDLPESVRHRALVEVLPPSLISLSGINLHSSYNEIRQQLRSVVSLNFDARLHKLLEIKAFGDQKPSQTLRQLLQLAEGNKDLALWKFKQLLPLESRPIILMLENENVTMDYIGDIADKLNFGGNQQQFGLPVNSLEARLKNIEEQVNAISFNRKGMKQTNDDHVNDVCWYHKTFGKNAKRCAVGCKFYNGQQENQAWQR